MPSEASLAAGQYYAFRHNQFWRIAGEICGFDADAPYARRKAALKRRRIALWDVVASCVRPGSLDASIRDDSIRANEFTAFLARHPGIRRVCFNGRKAESAWRRHVAPRLPKSLASSTACCRRRAPPMPGWVIVPSSGRGGAQSRDESQTDPAGTRRGRAGRSVRRAASRRDRSAGRARHRCGRRRPHGRARADGAGRFRARARGARPHRRPRVHREQPRRHMGSRLLVAACLERQPVDELRAPERLRDPGRMPTRVTSTTARAACSESETAGFRAVTERMERELDRAGRRGLDIPAEAAFTQETIADPWYALAMDDLTAWEGVEPSNFSALDSWQYDEDGADFVIPRGYGTLLAHYAKSVDVSLEHAGHAHPLGRARRRRGYRCRPRHRPRRCRRAAVRRRGRGCGRVHAAPACRSAAGAPRPAARDPRQGRAALQEERLPVGGHRIPADEARRRARAQLPDAPLGKQRLHRLRRRAASRASSRARERRPRSATRSTS